MTLAEDGIRLVKQGEPKKAAPKEEQATIPGFTWETLPRKKRMRLAGGGDLPCIDVNGAEISLQPGDTVILRDVIGQVGGNNDRQKGDGSWEATRIITVIDARIDSTRRSGT
jgi:hypothetical protein